MTVQLVQRVSRVHFPRSLRQELFDAHRRPRVKLLVLPAALGVLASHQTGTGAMLCGGFHLSVE